VEHPARTHCNFLMIPQFFNLIKMMKFGLALVAYLGTSSHYHRLFCHVVGEVSGV
jgi:hypothetical protein